jgi:hypothetical protein
MKLKELLHWDQSGGGGSPSFWIDEDSGDFFFQGYKVNETARTQVNCPAHEDLVRVPASFWEQLKVYAADYSKK